MIPRNENTTYGIQHIVFRINNHLMNREIYKSLRLGNPMCGIDGPAINIDMMHFFSNIRVD